jgi:Asp-tRNA(Asn)/Glu-tRNA(Gln) amidotransferase A subunit family amidase
MPRAKRPRALAVLETPGWTLASEGAKAAFGEAVARLQVAGIVLRNRRRDGLIAEIETALEEARAITDVVNAWESRWPLNTYREKNAGGLSTVMLDRLAKAESMDIADYRHALAARSRVRALYAKLAAIADGAIALSAIGAAPEGLHSTGNPIFAVAGSMLGVPAISLPVLEDEGLPLGLQVMGFEQGDAALVGTAAWLRDAFEGRSS